jgi:hypothetical protein
MSRELVCQSCGAQKMSLRKVKSSLITTVELIMCNSCVISKYEPRFIVILAARTVGIGDSVRKIINDRRYLGEEIPASDIL